MAVAIADNKNGPYSKTSIILYCDYAVLKLSGFTFIKILFYQFPRSKILIHTKLKP